MGVLESFRKVLDCFVNKGMLILSCLSLLLSVLFALEEGPFTPNYGFCPFAGLPPG